MNVTEHHATAHDGTRLSWTSSGAGGPPVVLLDGIGCAGYIWRPIRGELALDRRVIHLNYRGHGSSDAPRDPERMTVEDCVADLFSVLDDAGEPEAVLAGHSMGVQIALEAERVAPARVRALVLLCGAPGHLLDTFHDSQLLRLVFPRARDLVLRYPDFARLAFRAIVPTDFALQYALTFEVDGARVERSDLVRYLNDLAEVDPTLFVRLLASAGKHDATPHLPHVSVPTLVVAGERDAFTPMRLSVNMHRAIPGSELLVVPGGTHVAPLEDPELVAGRMRAFLAERAAPRIAAPVAATAALAAVPASAAAILPVTADTADTPVAPPARRRASPRKRASAPVGAKPGGGVVTKAVAKRVTKAGAKAVANAEAGPKAVTKKAARPRTRRPAPT
jgi:pimeloyl-ACP methyl ester carboxylesterase